MSKTNFFAPDLLPVHHYDKKVASSTFEVNYPMNHRCQENPAGDLIF